MLHTKIRFCCIRLKKRTSAVKPTSFGWESAQTQKAKQTKVTILTMAGKNATVITHSNHFSSSFPLLICRTTRATFHTNSIIPTTNPITIPIRHILYLLQGFCKRADPTNSENLPFRLKSRLIRYRAQKYKSYHHLCQTRDRKKTFPLHSPIFLLVSWHT